VEEIGKKMQNQTVLERREDKMKLAKDRIKMVKLQQKEENNHHTFDKKLQIYTQELNLSKKRQREMKGVIIENSKENEVMKKELSELLESNEIITKKLVEKKKIYDETIITETKKYMKQNRNETSEALLKKFKKDEYVKQVENCNKHLALDPKNLKEKHKFMKNKLAELDNEIIRTQEKMECFSKKKQDEKAFGIDDFAIFKTALTKVYNGKGKLSMDVNQDEEIIKLPNIVRTSIPSIAKLN